MPSPVERANIYYAQNKSTFLKNSENLLKNIKKIRKDDLAFYNAIIELIRKDITKIRNTDKNKPLALQLSENAIFYFKENNSLLKELAISYMHSHEWSNAVKTFESVKNDNTQLFDINDYHRLLKSYEMSETFDEYESLLLEGIKKYPENQDLQFRHLFISSILHLNQQDYSNALQIINLLLFTKKPSFWGLDTQHLLKYRNQCIINGEIKSINAHEQGMSIVSNRADGLGERLNAMLNAIVLAKTLGYKLGYTWNDLSHAQPFQKGTENKDNLIGHAIVDEHDFFDTSFIEKYSMTNKVLKNFRTITETNLSYEGVSALENKHKLSGWFSPRLALKEHLSPELLIEDYTYADAFAFIDFNKPIKTSIELAKKVMQSKDFIALHLRSGDVFYGEYRKFLHYSYKGIVLPLAKKIIKDHLKKGFNVVVFGQDREVLEYLKLTYGVKLVDDFEGFASFDETQKAMFEITLMSQAKSIIAGSSGFAKLASWIGNQETKSPMNFYNSKKQSAIIKKDLKENKDAYNKLQTSFAYWYGYFYGRNSKDIKEVEYFLTNAYKYDPDNPLYPIILSAHYYKNYQPDKAEEILSALFNTSTTYDINKNPVCSVLKARTMGKYNILEFIPIFEEAAKSGHPFALVIIYTLESNHEKKRNQLSNLKIYLNKNLWLNNFYTTQIKEPQDKT